MYTTLYCHKHMMASTVPPVTFWCLVCCLVLHLLSLPGGFAKTLSSATCPCSDASLCEPIKTIPKKEILAFSRNGPNWKDYRWDGITTVAVQDGFDPEMMCYAHSKGVRIVVWGSFTEAELFNKTARDLWVNLTIQAAVGNFTDGYNIDFESPLIASEAHILTDMVKQIKTAFTKALPYSRISFDTPWNPNCTAVGRCFDYSDIADIVDYLMIMAYDEVDALKLEAMANAPLYKTREGVEEFIKVGAPANKLVLGVPWYGYDFSCTAMGPNETCMILPADWRQRGYKDLMKLLADNSTTGRLWSDVDKSPYFDYKDSTTGQTHQVWYDDPVSLKLKYILAKDENLAGVAAFHVDCLDYSTDKTAVNETKAMWDAFVAF